MKKWLGDFFLIGSLFSIVLLLSISLPRVYAVCEPAMCGPDAREDLCVNDPTQKCVDKCCVPKEGAGTCGGAAWPSCSGWCSEGTVCQSGASYPCKCAAQLSCAEQLQLYGITYPLPTISRISPTSAVIAWQSPDPNAPRRIHHVRLRMAPASAGVDIVGQCNSCVVNEQNIDPYTQSSYTVDGLLTAGTLYNVQLLAYSTNNVPLPTACGHGELVKYLSSCTLSPDPMTLTIGESQTMTTELTDADGVAVTYQSGSSAIATVTNRNNPHAQPEQTRTTRVTGVANGTTVVSNKAELDEGQTWVTKCEDTATVNVGNVGVIQSRAVVVTASDTSCAAVRASTTGVVGTVHKFTAGSASQPPAQTQTGSSYVQFSNLTLGSYTLSPTVPQNYSLKRSCWEKVLAGSQGQGMTQTLESGETLTWDLGYTAGTAWFQAQGGDVYASGTLTSLVPVGISPRYFVLDDPGVVTYGTSYDFNGADVSSKKWLVNESYASTDWYSVFFNRFGSPTTPDYDCSTTPCTVTKPASRTTPYYVVGDMTTSGNWVVGNGTFIFLVDGNLTLGGSMNITGNGFIGFIVKGNITVSNSIGSAYTDSTPDIEGMYVTSPPGSFMTGTSSTAGKERLVLKGSFVSGNFLLQRDLDAIGQNTTTSSELFIYNPMLLVTMPDAMKEIKVTWKEVAP